MKEENEVEEKQSTGSMLAGCLQGTVAIFLLLYGLYILATI